MATKLKIKIKDDAALRNVLDTRYELSSQIKLCQYTLSLAKHILELVQYKYTYNSIIQDGFQTNEKWQKGEVRMHDVRQAGFKIHQLAKASDDLLIQTALRVVGQAVATGHMREHAMVASDYAVKAVNLKYPDDMEKVRQERQWQINQINSIEDLWIVENK